MRTWLFAIFFSFIPCAQPTPSLDTFSSGAWSLPSDTTAVVTGGTKGIGHAVVTELARTFRIHVLTCSRSKEDMDRCMSEWNSMGLGHLIHGVVADVSLKEGRDVLVKAAKKMLLSQEVGESPNSELESMDHDENGTTYRKLDILVNNVGTNLRKKTVEYTEEESRFIWRTNFESAFELCKALHPLMKRDLEPTVVSTKGTAQDIDSTKSNGGLRLASIVNVGSVAGVTCMKSGTPYASTKAAMNQLTGNLSCEWAPDGIRVNCVTPWYIRTPLAEQVLKNESYKRSILERTPMGRIGEPREVAGITAFLCLPIAEYITGQIISVDGAFTKNGYYDSFYKE